MALLVIYVTPKRLSEFGTGGDEVVSTVNGPNVIGHFVVPLTDRCPVVLFTNAVDELNFIEEFPRHDGRRIAVPSH